VVPPVLAVLCLWLLFGRRRRFNRHAHNIAKASQYLERLKQLNGPAQQLAYLRKIDPFVFEELILTAIKNAGGRIERNGRYTGDGGIDGKAVIRGRKFLIQAKRYRRHISAQHVKEFAELCRKQKREGLFVHTGRTGRLAREVRSETVFIVGGERLLKMLGLAQEVRACGR